MGGGPDYTIILILCTINECNLKLNYWVVYIEIYKKYSTVCVQLKINALLNVFANDTCNMLI